MVLDIIQNNPYRFLGVYSNSPIKDRVANANKIKAFAKVGKNVEFPLDLHFALNKVSRDLELLDKANALLNLDIDQLKYALFWFINKTSIDGIALGHLQNGDLDKAQELWGKKATCSSNINSAIISLIKEDYCDFISKISFVIHNDTYRNEFVTSICGDTFSIQEDNLAILFIDQLAESIPLSQLREMFETIDSNDNDKAYVLKKAVGQPIALINAAVSEAKGIDRKDADAQYEAGVKLMTSTKKAIGEVKSILGKDDIQYQNIADKLAETILQCGINYYNNTEEDDQDSIEKAYKLQNYAKSIAVGKKLKDHCKGNVDILDKKKANLPPTEVKTYHQELNNHINWFEEQSQSLSIVLKFLEKTLSALVSIKSVLGKSHKYYNKMSTIIANLALTDSIDALNEIQDANLPMLEDDILRSTAIIKLKKAFHDSWKIMLWLELMDTTIEFREKRLQPNKDTLKGILNQVDAFSPSILGDIGLGNTPFSGCAYNISIDQEMYMTEDEIFAKCNGRSGYQKYIKKYPQGKYVAEAKKWIADYDARIEARKKDAQEALIKDLYSCTNIKRCVDTYQKYKNSASDMTPLTNKFYNLCSSLDDYKKLVDTISFTDPNYKKAKEKIDYCKSLDDFSFDRDWWVILIIHSIWGLFGASDGIGGFFGGFAAGIAGWVIPINVLGYYIITWIRKQMIL